MRLTDLIVENIEREFTGVSSVDSLVEDLSVKSTIDAGLPIVARESEWETLYSPTRLSRSFSFRSLEKLKYFINEMLAYQNISNHHCLMIVEKDIVSIETYTHGMNNVTSLDLSLAKFADEVYEDTRFFSQ